MVRNAASIKFARLRHHGRPALSAATGIDAKKNM